MKRLFYQHWRPMLMVLLVQLLVNLLLMCGEILTKYLVDAALASSLKQTLPLAAARLLFVAPEILSVIVYRFSEAKCTASILKKLRENFAAAYLRKSYAEALELDSSDAVSRLTNDMSVIQDSGLGLFFMSSLGLVSLAASAAVMFFYSWKLALIAIVISSLMIIPPHLLKRKITRAQEKRSAARSAFVACVRELFGGFEIIVSFGAANIFKNRFDKINKQLEGAELCMGKTEALSYSIGQSFGVIAKVMILIFASVLLTLGEITTGTLVIFISLIGTLSGNLSVVLQTIPALSSISPLVERILPDEEAQNESAFQASFTQNLKLKNVSFGFEAEKPLFEDVNLEIVPGKKYALIGENGAGKTTLLRLLAGCFDDYKGEILYDSVPLRSLNRQSLSAVVSIIHQQPFVFRDTILFNITLGEAFPEDKIQRVAELCGIDRLRDGLMTQIEEQGKNLSGGQRQRISIARALMHNLPLLFIDEGSNALDAEMTAELNNCIFSLQNTAVIAITHDTSKENLSRYDKVLQIKDRKISVMDFPKQA